MVHRVTSLRKPIYWVVPLTLTCLLATFLGLPAADAQKPVPMKPEQGYQVHIPVLARDSPLFRVSLPLCFVGASAVPLQQPTGFVTRFGEGLQLNGQPYTFVGANASYLAGPFFPEEKMPEVISHLAEAGVQVIRVWVEPWCDLGRVERMLDLGREHNIRFILTLQDFFGHEDGFWFQGRYETVDLPHIRNIVPRFANRPEVLMWELMNEPTCPAKDAGQNCWDALYHWAQVTSQEVKRLDPNHLVSIGTQRAGFSNQAIDAFRRMHALATIDIVSIHCEAGKLQQGEFKQELAIAHELGKPVYFGEVTMRGQNERCQPLPDNALQRRAQAIATDIQQSLEAGVDGYLLWQYAYGGVDMGSHVEYFCGVFDYSADDPVWEVIKETTKPRPSP